MKKALSYFILITLAANALGCAQGPIQKGPQAAHPQDQPGESKREIMNAAARVSSALSGKDMRGEDLRRMERSVRQDPQTRTAIDAITQPVQAKYCPKDGKHFSGHLKLCPEHNIELIDIQED